MQDGTAGENTLPGSWPGVGDGRGRQRQAFRGWACSVLRELVQTSMFLSWLEPCYGEKQERLKGPGRGNKSGR